MSNQCDHGHLRRACEICERDEEIEQLRAERDAAVELLRDYEDDYRAVVNEQCAGDEKHCTCVPNLRKRIKEVEAERDALKDHVHRLESLCHDMAGELTVLRATKQMTAAIDAARGKT